jgi:hypothetical protein
MFSPRVGFVRRERLVRRSAQPVGGVVPGAALGERTRSATEIGARAQSVRAALKAASSSRLEARGMQGRAVKGEAGDTARKPSGKAHRKPFHMTYIVLCY